MAVRTPFTELFQVAHPLVLAPMGGVSGGALAAAVSEAGGLGLVGGGYGDPLDRDPALVRRELARSATGTGAYVIATAISFAVPLVSGDVCHARGCLRGRRGSPDSRRRVWPGSAQLNTSAVSAADGR